jgi:paraquat-inducible protein B
MTETPRSPDPSEIPEAVAAPKSRRTVQLVWLIPLAAALVGGWLAVKSIIDRGPTIAITFETADGLEAGKTKIKYKDVDIGLVTSVVLTRDAKKVLATAELVKGTEHHLVDDSRFWVVRARISGGTVSGLGTLLSGSYIGMDIGKSGKVQRDFIGLEVAPVIRSDTPGREFVLHSSNLGSLDVGSPVFFRRLQAGQISAYELDKDGKGVTMKVFVNSPYDRFVTENTRFWHASGIDVTLDAKGITVESQSLVAILVGGLAFETPLESVELPPVAAGATFQLFADRTQALKNPEKQVLKFIMMFSESLRGLAAGAPIDFLGIEVGSVTGTSFDTDMTASRMRMVVEADIYPDRLRQRLTTKHAALDTAARQALLARFVERGLRAQLRTGNLLTGQLYIALDFFPAAPKEKLRLAGGAVELPTVQSSFRELQATIASIATKIHDLPLKELGDDLHQTLQNANKLVVRLESETTPEATAALVDARKALASADRAIATAEGSLLGDDSALQTDTREAMREIARAAAAFRILADYLERHPEALISGKKDDNRETNK